MARRVAYHHGDLKNALIQAGLEIISAEGLAGLTLQKVAARLKVSRAALYRHFASKEELLAAIGAQGFYRLRDVIDVALNSDGRRRDPRAVFRASIEAYVAFAFEHPHHYEIMFGATIQNGAQYPEFQNSGAEAFERLLYCVKYGQERGVFKRRNPLLLAFSAWSALHGFVMLQLAGRNPFPISRPAQTRRLTGLLGQLIRRGIDV
jgi:AcrR family transcriptional regulator